MRRAVSVLGGARCLALAAADASLRASLRSLGRGATVELSPAAALEADPRLARRPRVFVNMIKTDSAGFRDVCEAVRRLRGLGCADVVPHVPASALGGDARRVVEDLYAAGARSALCLGGNIKAHESLDAAGVAALCQEVGISSVCYAGFPEDAAKLGALETKLKERPGGVVTQFTFSAETLSAWLDRAPEGAPLFVGVAGPASAKRLQRMAEICKVGPSVFVTAEAETDGGLVEPTEVVLSLAAFKARHPESREVALHLFPFGGTAPALDLIDRLEAGSWPDPRAVRDFEEEAGLRR